MTATDDSNATSGRRMRWLVWLVFVHLALGLTRLPGKVISRRFEEVAGYQKAGPEGWFFRGDAMHGREVITWLREHTPPSCVIIWKGERLGAMEFAAALLSPRFFARADEAERVAKAADVPVAVAELHGRRGRVVISATRAALKVSVR